MRKCFQSSTNQCFLRIAATSNFSEREVTVPQIIITTNNLTLVKVIAEYALTPQDVEGV